MTILSYAASKPKTGLERHEYPPAALGPHDIEVRVTHCGICHSDIHLIDDDWGMSEYPLVPGHEIIGTVAELGSGVGYLGKGQRVGIGWQRSACLSCEWCIRGEEEFCDAQEATCVGHPGGFARAIRADSRFAFAIPDALASENAAPLLCGGATVYTPLRRWAAPAMKVGVIGIGGLGHLALQFAAKMGCEVTAFSSSPDKEKEARSFGAARFVSSVDPAAMKKARGTLDFILSTATADLDWETFAQVLRPDGRLCVVGASPNPVAVSAFTLLGRRRSVCGSNIGSRTGIAEMLEFAARHGVQARTEVVPFEQVNEAIRKVRENRARYRMVLRMG